MLDESREKGWKEGMESIYSECLPFLVEVFPKRALMCGSKTVWGGMKSSPHLPLRRNLLVE